MGHRSTRQVVEDLRKAGMLVVINEPVSAYLEAAEIQRRVYLNRGPAVLFENVAGCSFPMVSNLFGSLEQARYIFRDTIEQVRRAIELKIDPQALLRRPTRYLRAPWVAWTMSPKKVRSGPITKHQTSLSRLPEVVSWPADGGPFVTLPQVLSQKPGSMRLNDCNLGMYRVQLSGNEYEIDREVGIHYQIHRGIGVHHNEALKQNRNLPVCISVGGSPAMTVAAVMPLPEGLSELTFAGALAGHRIRMLTSHEHAPIYADADFCIVGSIEPGKMKPEGPFGDHLGYYSLQHPYPVLHVHKVLHRPDAVWPFTVVGRPPQEDTSFGQLIHELTGPIIPTVIAGVSAVNAVDAAGVHPLLLAIGCERYMPFRKPDRPAELLTQANAILGQGQLSLAKYLWIANGSGDDAEHLDVEDVAGFLKHCLERVDWRRDLHFQTETTIDTLDYSGSGFNQGSKVVIAANGPPIRKLDTQLPARLNLPEFAKEPTVCLPGVLAIELPELESPGMSRATSPSDTTAASQLVDRLCESLSHFDLNGFPLIVVTEDAKFVSTNLNNFLWATFTRSNPAADIYGVNSSTRNKHWGCAGSLVIDIRRKPHHAPGLREDEQVTKRVDAMAARGLPISRYL